MSSPDIELRRAHNLGASRARAIAEKMAADLVRKFGLQGDWEGDRLHFRRPGLDGMLEVTGKGLHLTVTLGFLMKAMKASIERAVVQEIDSAFARLEDGVAPPRAAAARPRKPPAGPKKAR